MHSYSLNVSFYQLPVSFLFLLSSLSVKMSMKTPPFSSSLFHKIPTGNGYVLAYKEQIMTKFFIFGTSFLKEPMGWDCVSYI